MVVRHPAAGNCSCNCNHVIYHLFPLWWHYPSNCSATHHGNLDTPHPHVGQLRTPLDCGDTTEGEVRVNLVTM